MKTYRGVTGSALTRAALTALLLMPVLACGMLAAAVPAGAQTKSATRSTPAGPAMMPQRFSLIYEVSVAPPAEGTAATASGNVTVYVPFPSDSEVQNVENFSLQASAPEKLLSWELKREAEYGNRFIRAEMKDATPADKLTLRYVVTRRELANPAQGAVNTAALIAPPSPRFLLADQLLPLDGPVAALARETLAGTKTTDAKINAIYNKTVQMMRYDKSGTGWGRGDVVWACDNKRGNCTDFHSVIIGMARNARIPGKFEIGLSIPTDKEEGELTGYHCWAFLYHSQRGWVPLDASEGWKNEQKYKEYYRGHIGSDRVAFSIGRDIKLGQRGAPLNYFIYPYAENATGSVPMKLSASFKKLPLEDARSTPAIAALP